MTDTVVVTGAPGGAGSWIVDSLRSEYDVVAVDFDVPEDAEPSGNL